MVGDSGAWVSSGRGSRTGSGGKVVINEVDVGCCGCGESRRAKGKAVSVSDEMTGDQDRLACSSGS